MLHEMCKGEDLYKYARELAVTTEGVIVGKYTPSLKVALAEKREVTTRYDFETGNIYHEFGDVVETQTLIING